MRQIFVLILSFFIATVTSAQKTDFLRKYQQMLHDIPIIGEASFYTQEKDLRDSSVLLAFIPYQQNYRFVGKMGECTYRFLASKGIEDFSIIIHKDGILVFSGMFKEYNGEQLDVGFNNGVVYRDVSELLCRGFRVMCESVN